ncbi:MAG: hypothetical protein HYR85_23960 [Planctomycetes bacterium]|nr:hypothetical protein [Planctomycetota bacterium]
MKTTLGRCSAFGFVLLSLLGGFSMPAWGRWPIAVPRASSLQLFLRAMNDDPAPVPTMPVGLLPVVEVSLRNSGSEAVGLEFEFEDDRLWLPGRGASLELTGPSSRRQVYQARWDRSPRGGRKPLAPGETRRAQLPLAWLFAVPDGGDYQLTVTIVDALGHPAVSAPFRFHLDAPPLVTDVDLSIEASKCDTLGADVTATFTNVGTSVRTIIEPFANSISGGPIYWFIVRDQDGNPGWNLQGWRCGTGVERDPEPTLVALQPGASVTIPQRVNRSLDYGRNTIQLHYMLAERPCRTLPPAAEDLAIGRIISDEIVVEIPESAERKWMRVPIDEAVTNVEQLLNARVIPKRSREGLRELGFVCSLITHRCDFREAHRTRLRRALSDWLQRCQDSADESFLRWMIEIFADVADSTSVALLRELLLIERLGNASGRSAVAAALVRLSGRSEAVPVLQDLARRQGFDVRPAAYALQAFTSQFEPNRPHADEQNAPGQYDEATTAEEFDVVRERWLRWWAANGDAWLQGN